MGNIVARLDARAGRRRLINRGDDLHDTVFLGDLDPQPAILAFGLLAHLLEVARIQEARMRVERRQHPVDRAFQKLLVVHLLDILGAHALEDVHQLVELAIGLGIVRRSVRCRRRHGQETGDRQHRGDLEKSLCATHHMFRLVIRIMHQVRVHTPPNSYRSPALCIRRLGA